MNARVRCAAVVAGLVLVGVPAPVAATEPEGEALQPLIDSMTADPSFKVRLQAARVLHQRLERQSAPAAAVEAFGATARRDESAIVRAFAVRALGDLVGPTEGDVFNEIAASDPDPFVRAQAEAAQAKWAARVAEAPLLLLTVDPWSPEPERDRTEELRAALRAHAERLVGRRYRLGSAADGAGFVLRATVSELLTRPADDLETVTLELTLALATWPERNLRQVVTTRASARVAPTYTRRERLHQRLLDDAMKRAVSDALQHLEGG